MAAVYFDNNATTPLDPQVLDAMLPFLRECFGNPSSPHQYGHRAKEAIEEARERVAALLGCPADRLVFTSCGSEGNNTAILSAVLADGAKKRVVTSAVEHHCVLRRLEYLRNHLGIEVVFLPVDGQGQLDLDALARAVTPDTALVSLMGANNETGVLWPMGEIAELVASRGALFHCDAVQVAGKAPLSIKTLPVDYLTVSGHKLHGPKGAGALYVGRGAPFTPLLFGGMQEFGRRAGTQNVAGIVGFGQAAELARAFLSVGGQVRLQELRDHLEEGLLAAIDDVTVHGRASPRIGQYPEPRRRRRAPGNPAGGTRRPGFRGFDHLGLRIQIRRPLPRACGHGRGRPVSAQHPSPVAFPDEHPGRGRGFSRRLPRSRGQGPPSGSARHGLNEKGVGHACAHGHCKRRSRPGRKRGGRCRRLQGRLGSRSGRGQDAAF